ncbi:signal peptidase II [Anaerotignum sp.]
MRAIVTFFAILGLDLGTKKWAEEKLPLNQKKEIVKNRLYFWHIKNGGLAYNRFDGRRKGILLSTGALLALYSCSFCNVLRGKGDRRMALPLAVTLGGGYANFWERLKKGKVTDFLFIPVEGKNAPIFNLADIAIILGAVWLTILPFCKMKKK